MGTVAEAAGISEAYICRHFDDKLGLVLMSVAYTDLVANRDLVALQVHAQSAAAVPEIGAAVRHEYDIGPERGRAGAAR